MTSLALVNPFATFEVTDTWREGHRAVDYRTPLGTRFVSPGDGIYRRMPSELRDDIPGQAGHYGDLVLDNGRRIRFCHLDGHIARDGVRVERNKTILAVTGDTGFSSGPHMHTTGFLANGERWNWTLEAGAIPAGGGASPFDPEEEDNMALSDEDAQKIASAVWAATIGRDSAKVTLATAISQARAFASEAKAEATAAHAAIDEHVAQWIAGNPNAGTEPGRLYVWLRKAAEPAQIDLAALATLLAEKLPGGATPAQIETAVRSALGDLELTLKP